MNDGKMDVFCLLRFQLIHLRNHLYSVNIFLVFPKLLPVHFYTKGVQAILRAAWC